ncbi:MAG: hypothetical protein QF823_06835 [Candidatus Marinimicrobia bacterium]|nr:hypothetical protein [Candidatus Neomarinimicrobiota bacterium]
MIHLAISDSHLSCAQWSEKDGHPLLTSFTYKSFPRPISVFNNAETEIISVFNAGLHLIREDIPFEGDKVYVTLPDDFCQSVSVPMDTDMTESDGWEFGRWSLNQRWHSEDSFEYFGRHFADQPQSVFVIRVSTIFTEPIKLAIQELGGEAVWMGTESSAFFGLSPEAGCTVFHPGKNGYQYYHYSPGNFLRGSARYLKNQWKIHPLVGSGSLEDVFSGQLIFAGQLSEKRKAHFKSREIKQLTALDGIKVEGDLIPKEIREEDLYVLTSIATGNIVGVTLNFFWRTGLQKYEFEKPIDVVKPKTGSAKPDKKRKKTVKKKTKQPKKKINLLQPFLYLFFFTTIAIMLTYDQKPELFDSILKLNIKELLLVKNPDPVVVKAPPVKVKKIPEGVDQVPGYLIQSQSLLSTATRTIELSGTNNILLMSLSDGRMDLELVGSKTMATPIDSLGDVLNYSLRQVNGNNQFQHGYLVNYPSRGPVDIHPDLAIDELHSFISEIDQSFIKSLEPIEREDKIQIPTIVQIRGVKNINQLLGYLSSTGKNLAIEKFVFTNNLENTNPSAVFYISIFTQPQPKPVKE